jgi:hypothetical protein
MGDFRIKNDRHSEGPIRLNLDYPTNKRVSLREGLLVGR